MVPCESLSSPANLLRKSGVSDRSPANPLRGEEGGGRREEGGGRRRREEGGGEEVGGGGGRRREEEGGGGRRREDVAASRRVQCFAYLRAQWPGPSAPAFVPLQIGLAEDD